ncbi:MAG: serine hydrolase domain-containing protein [Caulobacterales bacterium]
MAKVLVALGALILACLSAGAQTAPARQTASSAKQTAPIVAAQIEDIRVASFVDGVMAQAMAESDAPGAAITIVKDGRVLMAKGYGVARLAPAPLSTDAETLFQVASISKTPVYIAAMQLVELGKLDLAAPVNQYLSADLKIPDDGFKEPIRVRDLFTHTAGFEDLALGHLFAGDPAKLTTISAYLKAHRPKRVRAPGTLASYSNYSLALLGHLIETISGMAFDDYMEARVLRPLGMRRATYRDPIDPALAKARGLPAPMAPDLIANSTQQLKGRPGAWKVAQLELTGMIAPAGGMKASAQDMAAYLTALLDPALMEAAGVLKAATFKAMIAAPAAPGLGLVHHGFIPYELPGGRRGFGHGGAMAYGASDLVVVPELGLGIFVTTNSRAGFSFAYDVAARIVGGLYPAAEKPPVVRNAATIAAAKALEGPWIATRRAFHTSERAVMTPNAMSTIKATDDGDLLIGRPLAPAMRFQPLGDGRWRPVKPGWSITAAPGPDGKTVIYSASGTQARERAGPIDTPLLFLGAPLLAFFTALAALYSWPGKWGARRDLTRLERFGAVTLDFAALGWALGLGWFFVTLAGAASDGGAALLFIYPGPFAAIGWIIALAAAFSLVAWVSAPALIGRGAWGWWRRIKHVGVLCVFTLAALVCWRIGLVGFTPS